VINEEGRKQLPILSNYFNGQLMSTRPELWSDGAGYRNTDHLYLHLNHSGEKQLILTKVQHGIQCLHFKYVTTGN